MPSVSLWASSAEILFLMFELPENLRIFWKLFFTKRGRSGQLHRILKTHFPAGAFRVKMCLERPCDCKAMKAPVGLSSRRAVCVSRWKGFALTSVRAATNAKNKNQIPLNMPRVQQRRPLPAAEAGRSCWGRGQQDTNAAQGMKWMLGAATLGGHSKSFNQR